MRGVVPLFFFVVVWLGRGLMGIRCSVVPSEDAHQSEYVSAGDKRREWISQCVRPSPPSLPPSPPH